MLVVIVSGWLVLGHSQEKSEGGAHACPPTGPCDGDDHDHRRADAASRSRPSSLDGEDRHLPRHARRTAPPRSTRSTSTTPTTLFPGLVVNNAGEKADGPDLLRRRRATTRSSARSPATGPRAWRASSPSPATPITLEEAEAAGEAGEARRRGAGGRRHRLEPSGYGTRTVSASRTASIVAGSGPTRSPSAYTSIGTDGVERLELDARRRGTCCTIGCETCVPLNTLGKFTSICSRGHLADHGDVEQAVVERRARRDVHPAAVRRAVADRDEPRAQLVRLAVDGEPERVRLVDGERAQHGRDVERGAREPVHGVGPAVRLGVEARRGHARVPAAVDAAEVDDAVVAVLERAERVERMLRVVAEPAREVVAGAGRARSRACGRCRPRRRRPRRRDRRRRTRRDRGPASAASRASRDRRRRRSSDTSTLAPTPRPRVPRSSGGARGSDRARPTGLTITSSVMPRRG